LRFSFVAYCDYTIAGRYGFRRPWPSVLVVGYIHAFSRRVYRPTGYINEHMF